MLNQQTMAQLQALGLQGMLRALNRQLDDPSIQKLNFDERFVRNRSLSGVLFQPAPARNNPSHIHQGGAGSDQSDSDQQQVAAA